MAKSHAEPYDRWHYMGRAVDKYGEAIRCDYAFAAMGDRFRVVREATGELLFVLHAPRGCLHGLSREAIRVGIDQILAKGKAQTEAAKAGAAKAIGEEAKRWPLLMELLCTDALADGTPREISKLTIRRDGAIWNAGVSEVTLNASAWGSGETIVEAIDALERRLAGNPPDLWRRWGGGNNYAPKGKKRG